MDERGTGLSTGALCISGPPSSGSTNRQLAWTRGAPTDEGIYVRRLQVIDISADESKHMFLSRHQNVGCSYNIKTANKSFETVAELKYVVSTLTNHIFMKKLRADQVE